MENEGDTMTCCEEYERPGCGAGYSTQQYADDCCPWECPECHSWHRTEEGRDSCCTRQTTEIRTRPTLTEEIRALKELFPYETETLNNE